MKAKNQGSFKIRLSSKGILTIPMALRKKYQLDKGAELDLIDEDGRIAMIPHATAEQLFGIASASAGEVHDMLRELDREHRDSARDD
nr:AbrB/MazE/SpoVT family DNA-binding domain-containing protein [Candidatus Sigynarchaeum springense]